MNRGAARRPVFQDDADYHRFCRCAESLPCDFGVEVHGLCLMPNHYHLLVRTPEPNLPDAMRHLAGTYTQGFHRRHRTDGPLFRGRYHAVLVQQDVHLVHVSRYIHLNPVDAGLVSRPERWFWSSYQRYVSGRGFPWVRRSVLLAQFGGRESAYRQFVELGVDEETSRFFEGPERGPVFGNPEFVQAHAKPAPDAEARSEEPTALHRLRTRIPLELLEYVVERCFGASPRGPGRFSGTGARAAFVLLARRSGWRVRDIAEHVGWSSAAAAAMAVRRFERDATPEDRRRLHQAETHLRREVDHPSDVRR
jgi:putative transposase